MSDLAFACLSERPELQELVARWLWGFWGNPRNYEFYRSMAAHSQSDGLPLTYVALLDGEPAGTVSLLRADLFSRQDLCPWLADLYVPLESRSRGIGSALQEFAIKKASELGYPALYLYTPLKGYYEKTGWEYIGDETDRDGELVRIYRKDLA